MSREAIKTLISEIRADLQAIDQIFYQLDETRLPLKPDQPASLQEKATIGYLLHNLYSAFENIFKNIASAFGNAMGPPETWHAHLLRRMTLEIESVRPKVIGMECYEALDELRRFRHLFRHAYALELDWDRMGLVLRKMDMLLRDRYREELDRFIGFLEDLATP
jgi:hypothetical protein